MSSRTTARRQAAELQRQREAHRQRRVRIVSAVVVIAVLAAIVGVLIVSGGSGGSKAAGGPSAPIAVPAGVTDGAIVTGQASAPVTLTLYEDLQCPACRAFEASTGSTIADLVAAGTVKVERRPLAFLDSSSTDDYSTRALNAVGCVQNTTPAAVDRYITLLFQQQPEEGGAGLPNATLASIATSAGSADVSQCINGLTYQAWTQQQTQLGTAAGVDSTPTVLVNGKPLADRSPAGLRSAVQAAAAS